jgi:DNA replicative helicase MCM subunit Mcm2 (Cdc46/Mcm family)
MTWPFLSWQLTDEAMDLISSHYAGLRSQNQIVSVLSAPLLRGVDRNRRLSNVQSERTVPITPRTLETLIRLSTAHAKV